MFSEELAQILPQLTHLLHGVWILGQFFREQLNPSITGSAVGVGGLGGSRQGIAQGMGVNSMMQQFQQGATGIMNNAYNT